MGIERETERAVKELISRLSKLLYERITRFKHLSLSDVAGFLLENICSLWHQLTPDYHAPVKKLDDCSLVVDFDKYAEYLAEELTLLANRIVDLAMEALAKHVDTLPGALYARLSWLIVTYSSTLAHNLTLLAKLAEQRHKLLPLIEFVAVTMTLRALALYNIVANMSVEELAKHIDSIDSFIHASMLEENGVVTKLLEGAKIELPIGQ